jgi:hypothetical protein
MKSVVATAMSHRVEASILAWCRPQRDIMAREEGKSYGESRVEKILDIFPYGNILRAWHERQPLPTLSTLWRNHAAGIF